MLSVYVASLPAEIEEQALVDGADRLGVLRFVTLPLALPGLVVTFIFSFLLAWNDAAIVKLARFIDREQAFERLPILADALEEAGCTDADVLAHCRAGGTHVRGCWVIDLVSGRA